MRESPIAIQDENGIETQKIPLEVIKSATKEVETKEEVHPADLINLRVYATLSGRKWDQMAGFVSYANRNKLGPMTVQNWNLVYEVFQGTPVK